MVWLVERSDEALNLIVIALRHIRVNEDRLLDGAIQRGLEFQFSRLKAVDLVTDQQGIDAILDGLDQLHDGFFSTLQLRSIGMERRVVFMANAVRVGRVLCTKDLAQIRVHQPLAQRAEDDLFELALANGEAVRARPFVTGGRATVLSGGDLCEAAAAVPAFEQEGKQLFRTALHRWLAHAVERSLLRLGTVPQFIVNDPEMGDIRPHPFRFIVEGAVLAAGVRVLRELLFVPALAAHIQRVPKNAGFSPPVALDGA